MLSDLDHLRGLGRSFYKAIDGVVLVDHHHAAGPWKDSELLGIFDHHQHGKKLPEVHQNPSSSSAPAQSHGKHHSASHESTQGHQSRHGHSENEALLTGGINLSSSEEHEQVIIDPTSMSTALLIFERIASTATVQHRHMGYWDLLFTAVAVQADKEQLENQAYLERITDLFELTSYHTLHTRRTCIAAVHDLSSQFSKIRSDISGMKLEAILARDVKFIRYDLGTVAVCTIPASFASLVNDQSSSKDYCKAVSFFRHYQLGVS